MTVEEATRLARDAHDGQVDKAGKPYIEHVCRVRDALAEHGDDAQVAGVLHDVLEDTTLVPGDLVRAGVPAHVLQAVVSVTRYPGEKYMHMIRRATADPLGRLVKLADNADNSDEARLAELDAEMAEFLRTRYAKARAVLEAQAG